MLSAILPALLVVGSKISPNMRCALCWAGWARSPRPHDRGRKLALLLLRPSSFVLRQIKRFSMIRAIDHVVILVNDLAATVADYTALGFTVTPGGEHTGGATHNALVVFADD